MPAGLQYRQATQGRHPDHAYTIIGSGADYSRHSGAMRIGRKLIPCSFDEIVMTCNLCLQLRVFEVGAGIDNCNVDAVAQ